MRLLLLAAVGSILPFTSLRADPLPVGSPAPNISALDQSGEPLYFSSVYGRGVTLVYFYPKAFTGGCTAEACSLRDNYATLANKGLQIIGVSKDDAATQLKFQQANHLPFSLVADTDGKVAEAFGVPHMLFESRESFLIKGGKIVWNSPHAQTAKSAQEVEAALAGLK